MSIEYAPRGLVGLLTPQANTKAEPELNALWPGGIGMVAARMTSLPPTIEVLLVEYYLRLDGTVQQFGNAPMGVVASACNGSSYLMGPAREDELSSGPTHTTGDTGDQLGAGGSGGPQEPRGAAHRAGVTVPAQPGSGGGDRDLAGHSLSSDLRHVGINDRCGDRHA